MPNNNHLIGETDAQVWAYSFVHTLEENPDIASDSETMLAWFSGAIMAGYDKAAREVPYEHSLNELATECHATAVAKGFYEVPDIAHLIKGWQLMRGVGRLMTELESARKNESIEMPWTPDELDGDQLNACMKLLLIMSECWETFLAVCERSPDEDEEVADIFIRLADYVGWRNIDFDVSVIEKMEKNSGRPHKHGCNF